jgi:bifunctional pyridoxal-dependent enzyme with beta-cystathionase and maltose regulon repressor activities
MFYVRFQSNLHIIIQGVSGYDGVKKEEYLYRVQEFCENKHIWKIDCLKKEVKIWRSWIRASWYNYKSNQ